MKTQFWDRRATLNLAAFRTTIDDYQANVSNGQFGVLRGYLANADQVRTQGVEVDFSVRPSERFTAYVNGAYTDAKYVKFVDAPCPPELAGGTTSTRRQAPGAPGVPGRAQPGELRHFGPAPAGRLEVGVLVRRGGQRAGQAVRRGGRGLFRRRRQLPLASSRRTPRRRSTPGSTATR